MKQSFVRTPQSISFNDIANKDFVLSSSQYMDVIIPNKNLIEVRDFLDRKLNRKDLGLEVGSLSYIQKSTHFFMRTKALQSHSFLPDITSESVLPILPQSFVNMNLKEGDLIISKDSNIGEIVILDKDYPNTMLSGALYKLPVSKNKLYLLAMIKHRLFREQLDLLVPKGATIRHAKTLFLDCKIPMPNRNTEDTIKFIEVLMQAIINKEKLIRARHEKILSLIETELSKNQKPEKFCYKLPTILELIEKSRLDSNMYGEYFKKELFKIENYSEGCKSIFNLGFSLSRGQNLQVSNIGKSIYSDVAYQKFYTLMLPKFLSKYGTINDVAYLGNPNKLKTLEKGDLIFGAEGFEKGRSIVVIEENDKVITNIHGITIQQRMHDVNKAVFTKCFLDYLRSKGLIDLYAVGGNGGSLAQKYWDIIPFPNFPESKQKEIAILYHNPEAEYQEELTLENFLKQDDQFNEVAGIYELDKTAKRLKEILNSSLEGIANDLDVQIRF